MIESVTQLANTVTSALLPFLPTLVSSAADATAAIAKLIAEHGQEAWDFANKAWQLLASPDSTTRSTVRQSAEFFAQDPFSSARTAAVAETIEKHLATSPQLAESIRRLLDAQQPTNSVARLVAKNRARVAGVRQMVNGGLAEMTVDNADVSNASQEVGNLPKA